MKISIIVPIYNVKDYIERCIESILTNTYKNLEIILVNDGATDGSADIIRKYQVEDNRVIIINRENGGLSAARNSGIEVATGDYILFVDGDDWINPNCISKCIPYMNEDVDVVMFSFIREYGDVSKAADLFKENEIYFMGEDKERLVRRFVGPIGEEMATPHKIEDINVAHCKFYKRYLIKGKVFIDTKIIGTEDLWFNLSVFSEAKKIVYINEHLYHYNKKNEFSLTRVYNDQLFNRWKVLYSYIENFIENNGVGREAERALKNRKVIELLALARNVTISNLGRKEKRKELVRILEDNMYVEAFQNFDYSWMPIQWRLFYKSCEFKKVLLISVLLFFAEKFKKKA